MLNETIDLFSDDTAFRPHSIQTTRPHSIPYMIYKKVSIIAIGCNFVVMVGQVRFDSKAIPHQRLTTNLRGWRVHSVVLILTLVISLVYIPVQRLAMNAHYLMYPKCVIMSEPCSIEEKCGVLGGGIGVIKVHGTTNPSTGTK